MDEASRTVTSGLAVVPQVWSPTTGVVITRSAAGSTAFSTEEFALALPAGFTTAQPPSLSCLMYALSDLVGPNMEFDVTVTVTNATGRLTAGSPEVTLTLRAHGDKREIWGWTWTLSERGEAFDREATNTAARIGEAVRDAVARL